MIYIYILFYTVPNEEIRARIEIPSNTVGTVEAKSLRWYGSVVEWVKIDVYKFCRMGSHTKTYERKAAKNMGGRCTCAMCSSGMNEDYATEHHNHYAFP